MAKKWLRRLSMMALVVSFVVGCSNPADTTNDDTGNETDNTVNNQTDDNTGDNPDVTIPDPIYISLDGVSIDTATFTTDIIPATESTDALSTGSELVTTDDDIDAVKVLSGAVDGGYEIRCEILFDTALDLSTASTFTYDHYMFYSYTILTIKTENATEGGDDVTTLVPLWHGQQLNPDDETLPTWYSNEIALTDDLASGWGDTAWGSTTKKVTKIEIFTSNDATGVDDDSDGTGDDLGAAYFSALAFE